uniref:Ribosomal protein S20 n=1 Tax=Pleurostichidium falkenbergii TaxID=121064 RepID=A0A4D6UW48_9FLOR|nr:ribosomal protein S20 [Pleurostichidium falkenbergii]QCH39657.1 ribosomal protein S20 [Pleurostichidium falkenbergii]
MPQTKSHIKNSKVILRNRSRNKKYKFAIKKAIKTYLWSVELNVSENSENSLNLCLNNLSLVYQTIDKAVKKRILHHNTASRKKSKLAKILK